MADQEQAIADTNGRSTNYERYKAEAERDAAIRQEKFDEWLRKLDGDDTNTKIYEINKTNAP
jgi:hypothetical protein